MVQTDKTQMHDIVCHDLAATALERSQFYALLAAIFNQEPGIEFLEQLRGEAFQSLLAQSGFSLGDEFTRESPDTLQKELSEEFTRLFLGPGKHIAPYESVQLKRGSGTLWGEETVMVKRFIEAAGFNYENDFIGIPDHISVELEFLSRLAGVEAGAWAAGNVVAADNALEWQRDFVSRHADKWMPDFCCKVTQQARLSFYGTFALVLRQFLAGEKTEIADRQRHQIPITTHPAAIVPNIAAP